MPLGPLTFGQSLSGLLVDGVEGTPYASATLTLDENRGVQVEVPFIEHDTTGQFTHVDEWFSDGKPPRNMTLHTPDGDIGLYGNGWTGARRGFGVSAGKIAPQELLLGTCEAPLTEPFAVTELRSEVDHLRRWTLFNSIHTDHVTDENGLVQELLVHVKSGGEVTWQQGDAQMSFATQWKTSHPEDDPQGGLNIADSVVLVSKFATSAPVPSHLAEQRKVVNLLTLIVGDPVRFRRHEVADETIVSRSAGGTILSHPRRELLSQQTVREYVKRPPRQRAWLLAPLSEIGPEGLTVWAEQHERWSRFILPAVAALGREGRVTEDLVVSCSMSIEAAGSLIGVRDGEEVTYNSRGKATTATYVYRCLHVTEWDWEGLAPDRVAMARAVANTYNDIKHFNRGEFPDPFVSLTIARVASILVRLTALHVMDESGRLMAIGRRSPAVREMLFDARHRKLTFNEQGKPVFGEGE